MHIDNRIVLYSLMPQARSRLDTTYMARQRVDAASEMTLG
jgi:DNA-binding TFAR19-related protein (PDSD5 family)